MSMVKEQWEFLQDVAMLIQFIADETGFIATAGEMWRTEEQQRIYVDSGRSQTMNSKHRQRLAIDLNFFDSDSNLISDGRKWKKVGEYWESLNAKNQWGGNWASFRDYPHLQRG